MPPVIRTATRDDLPRIVDLLAQLAPDVPDREDPSRIEIYAAALARTEAQGQRLLVSDDARSILGTLALVIVENLSHRGSPYAIIENVVVDEAARGRGHGEALIRAAIEQAREAGCYKISLTSNKRRTNAHRFYERLGFQRTHEAFRITL
ncbi:MAG TPA: GNAT family N-acetyltransferase [Dehalococcoidia bacterium]|nr:GNAT family N-acetyltransferase [Dehalococcoidia bacterium]